MDLIQKIDDLEIERSRLFKELQELSEKKLNYKSSENRWSINQHLYHGWLAETTTEKYIKTKTKYPDLLLKASTISNLRSLILKSFLNFGFKFKAPKFVSTFPEKIDLNELNQNWTFSRKSFKTLIEELNSKNLINLAINRHPLLGRINMHLTLDFFDFHFDHHQKAINKLKK